MLKENVNLPPFQNPWSFDGVREANESCAAMLRIFASTGPNPTKVLPLSGNTPGRRDCAGAYFVRHERDLSAGAQRKSEVCGDCVVQNASGAGREGVRERCKQRKNEEGTVRSR